MNIESILKDVSNIIRDSKNEKLVQALAGMAFSVFCGAVYLIATHM